MELDLNQFKIHEHGISDFEIYVSLWECFSPETDFDSQVWDWKDTNNYYWGYFQNFKGWKRIKILNFANFNRIGWIVKLESVCSIRNIPYRLKLKARFAPVIRIYYPIWSRERDLCTKETTINQPNNVTSNRCKIICQFKISRVLNEFNSFPYTYRYIFPCWTYYLFLVETSTRKIILYYFTNETLIP